jgi:lipid II:glycine glycyltransferase (peptidoglycan interpeptide bridge formation enzyme)
MLFNVCCKDTEELYETPIVQQTAFWSDVKAQLGAGTLGVNFKARQSDLFHRSTEDKTIIFSDILAVIRQIDRYHSIAYIPYGPELEPSEEFQGMFLEELSESIRPFLPKDCILIRYDLCWQSYWAKDEEHFDENGIWKGQPDSLSQEFRFNFNTHRWNFKKAYFNILPSNTIYLDLTQDADAILRKMKSKTRYNITIDRVNCFLTIETYKKHNETRNYLQTIAQLKRRKFQFICRRNKAQNGHVHFK